MIIIIAIIAFFVGISIIAIKCKPQHNKDTCLNCGGHYEFIQAVGHQLDTSYIYKCNKCGKIIETYEIIK